MKKKLLMTSAFVALLGSAAHAQITAVADRKWDTGIENLLHQDKMSPVSPKGSRSIAKEGVILSCSNTQAVAEAIKMAGYKANIIDDNVITAEIPVGFIENLADMDEVEFINAPRQFYPTLHTVRPAIGVDKIHKGEGLETPFTGKGVILGVIDQGFEYRHKAFLDKAGNTRVRAMWNHINNQNPTTDIPGNGDQLPTGGHATHVTCIAAGSNVESNPYYGIAPDAEIIMIPSNFKENYVLEETKYISDFAKKEDKPFVINMSFGSQIGPHDGSLSYDRSMSKMSGPGAIFVAAMGNEGEMKLHTHHKFTKNNETVSIIVQNDDYNKSNYIDIWGQATDGQNHLKLKPFIYNRNSKKREYKSDYFWINLGISDGVISPANNKEHFSYYLQLERLGANKSLFLGFEITGNTGDEFHAWVNPGFGEFMSNRNLKDVVLGDNEYCVGEGASCIPAAISVASYNSNDGTFLSAPTGNKLQIEAGKKGEISSFSSVGPFLGKDMKPLVSAPGHNVFSAISKYGSSFDRKDPSIVNIVNDKGKKYYYATMSGTSMATPAVSGTVALWLEANPELTHDQIKEIIKTTAKRDINIGAEAGWDPKSGYGKLDAYAGLKKALELAEQSGISDQLNNSTTPVTLMKEANQTRVLFNNDETYANISLYNASGMLVKSEQLEDIHRGHETVISTVGLPKGVYVVRINTTASAAAKKILVK